MTHEEKMMVKKYFTVPREVHGPSLQYKKVPLCLLSGKGEMSKKNVGKKK